MEQYKKEFIEFLLSRNALKFAGDFTLKSGRMSPYFVNIGDFNDGESTSRLGQAYAHAIKSALEPSVRPLLYGIPEKGVGLAIATSIELARIGIANDWFFTRKMPKEHGESSAFTLEEKMKSMIVGRQPRKGDSIIQLDDVFTAGDAKYEARKTLQEFGEFNLPLLAIAVDRQEVGINGISAIEKYEKETGTKVVSIVTAAEIYQYLKEQKIGGGERMSNYIRVYGTTAAKKEIGVDNPLDQRIIKENRSIIPACDIESLEQFEKLVSETHDVPGIGGYKVGFELGLGYGLPRVVETARKYTQKPIIYDHQKAATDIPDTGKNFAKVCKKAGIDSLIFFPQAGPETERAWICHALDAELSVIVGGRMTHAAYAQSEGGFITDEGALEMYRIAARAGINNFVVPGNKPAVISEIRKLIEAEGVSPIFYAPGFVAQGGKISDAANAAGNRWHAIVGRGIYQAPDYKAAAIEHTKELKL